MPLAWLYSFCWEQAKLFCEGIIPKTVKTQARSETTQKEGFTISQNILENN